MSCRYTARLPFQVFPMATPEQLLQALQTVVDPNTGKDFVSTKQLKNLTVEGGSVSFDVELGYPAKSQIPALRQALIAAAKADAAKATDAKLAAASARIDETVTTAETRIAAARAAALGEVEGVAAEAAQDIASRLAGLSIPAAEAQAAVKGVLANG